MLCAQHAWRYWLWRGNLRRGPRADHGRAGARRRSARAAPAGAERRAARSPASRATSRPRRELFEESLAVARELGDDYRVARVEGNLGSMALYARDYDEAIERYERSTAYFRSVPTSRAG